MRVFRNTPFRRFMQEFGIRDAQLCAVVDELSSGLVHATLAGGVYKQRLARKGQGKSGGFRSIVLFRLDERAFFVFGFRKERSGESKCAGSQEPEKPGQGDVSL
jgi:hypothetical protein